MPDEKQIVLEEVTPVVDAVPYESWSQDRNSGTTLPKTAEPEAEAEGTRTAEESEASPVQTERDEHGKFKPREEPGVEKRIGKAVAKQREAERRAEEAERRLAELSARPATPPIVANSPVVTDAEPNQDNFNTYDEFVRAVSRWEARQELAAERKAEAAAKVTAAQQEAGKEAIAAWQENETATKEKHADYQEVMDTVKDVILTPAMQFFLLQTDAKAEIAYYLGQNREELERINTLEPHRIAYELGRIDARLEQTPSGKHEKRVSTAPRPPRPVGNRASTSNDATDASEYEDFASRRNRQLHGGR